LEVDFLQVVVIKRAVGGRLEGGGALSRHEWASHRRSSRRKPSGAVPPERPLRRVTWVQPGSPGASSGPSWVVVAARRGRSTDLLRRAVKAGFSW
jgi:hypothetical protein